MVQAASNGQTIIDGGYLRAALIDVDTILAKKLTIRDGGSLQSENYKADKAGWRISSDGSVEFTDGKFRGKIDATTGTLNNVVVSGNSLFKGQIISGPLELTQEGSVGLTVNLPAGTPYSDALNRLHASGYKEGFSEISVNPLLSYFNNIPIHKFIYIIRDSYFFIRAWGLDGTEHEVSVYKGRVLGVSFYATQSSPDSYTFKLKNIPTTKPLDSGTVWNNNGVLNIV